MIFQIRNVIIQVYYKIPEVKVLYYNHYNVNNVRFNYIEADSVAAAAVSLELVELPDALMESDYIFYIPRRGVDIYRAQMDKVQSLQSMRISAINLSEYLQPSADDIHERYTRDSKQLH